MERVFAGSVNMYKRSDLKRGKMMVNETAIEY